MRFLKSLSEKGFKQELVKTTQNAEIASDNTFNTYKEGEGSGEGGEREWRDRENREQMEYKATVGLPCSSKVLGATRFYTCSMKVSQQHAIFNK